MKTKEDIALYWMKQNSMTLQQRFWEAMEEYRLQSHPSPMSAEQVEDISKTIFASIDHYREAGRDDEFNIKSIAEYLQRHFATTPSVKAEGFQKQWQEMESEIQKHMDEWDEGERLRAGQATIDLSKIIINS